jgi:hypothetical protein
MVTCIWSRAHVGRCEKKMVAKRTGKLAGLAAFLAGLGWVAKDLGGRFSPDPEYWDCNSSYDYLLNTTDTAAFLLLVPALIGLYQAYRTSVGATARFAALASATGFGVAGTANLLEHCAAMSVLGFAYVIGGWSDFSCFWSLRWL